MDDLFANDPAFKYRDSKGRFSTPERHYADKAMEDNKVLRLQVERYRRAWLSAGRANVLLTRENKYLKEQLNNIKIQASC